MVLSRLSSFFYFLFLDLARLVAALYSVVILARLFSSLSIHPSYLSSFIPPELYEISVKGNLVFVLVYALLC